MSENTAEIRVGLDASGVESGLLRIDQAATRTGRTVENLGRANGFQQLGAGAAESGDRIGRTTQNLIASIKRTTEAMGAGTRGTAEYYSQLANSRGANLAQLQPYINQLREVTERTQAAAAAQRQLAARDDFLSSLRDQADAVGKTAAELMEMRAAELGVAEAAQPLIDRLREAEEASGGLGESIRGFIGPAAAAAAVVAGLVKTIQVQREFDGLNSGLVTATGSAENAAQAFKALQAFAATTPYSLAETTAAFIQMRNLGLDPSERALRSYGNTAAAMSKSLEQMVEAVADASTGEYERLKEFGIKASQNGDQVALTFQGVTTTVRNSADEIEKYLQKLGETKFGGGMELQANTLSGAISNLGDAWDAAFLKISQGGIGEAAKNTTLGVSAALTDLVAILDAAAGAADAHSSSLSATTVVHETLRTAFEAVTVLGINVAYVLTQIGKELGGLAAQAVSVATGEFAQARLIGQMMREEAEQARKDVDARSEAILTASTRARKAAEEEAAAKKAAGRDDLARFKIAREAEEAGAESSRKAAAAAKAQADAYRDLRDAIDEQAASIAREAAGLDPLTKTQALQVRLDKELLEGKVKLSKQAEQALRDKLADARADEISVAMQKRVAQGNEERARAAAKLTESLERQVAEAVKEAARNEELARTYGMTKSAVEQLTLARLEEQLAQKTSKGLYNEEIEALEQVIDAKRRSVAAIGAVEAVEASKRANEALAADWKRTMDGVDDVFREGFADMLNNGRDGWKSFTKSLVTTFKTSVADAIYKMFAQPFVVRMVAAVMGVTGAPGLAQAAGVPGAGGAGDIAGIASAAQAAYKAISSGFDGISTAVADSVQAALYKSGATSQIASNGAFANAAGNLAGVGAGYVAGSALNKAISSGYETGSGVMKLEKLATVAASAIFGPVGGAIAGAVSGLVNRAFGMKERQSAGSTLNGMFGAGGFEGSTDSAWTQKGGWFRSDKSGVDKVTIDAELAAQFGAGYNALKASAADFASVLGVNADAIKSRTQALSIALSGDQAKDGEAIAKFFTGVGDQIAVELVPTISQFAKAAAEFGGAGESASATLQRIAGNYAFIDAALASIGDTFGAVGLDSVAARERLLELTGGLEAFGRGTAFFAQNFLTEAERLEPVRKTVTDTLASLGLAMVDTREEFKSVVLGLDLTSETGAKTYASLMGVQEQFAALYPAVEATTDALDAANKAMLEQRKNLQEQLDELTMSPAEKVARARGQVDPSNVDLFDQVQAATAQKAAAEAARQAAEALVSVNQSYQRQIDELRKSTMSAAEVRAFEIDGMDASTVALYDRLAALKLEVESSKASADAVIAAAKARANAFQSFGDGLAATMTNARKAAESLRNFNESLTLGALSALDPDAKYREAKRQFEAAAPTDTAAVTAFLEASKARDADQSYYTRDFAAAQAKIAAGAAQQDSLADSIPAFWRTYLANQSAPVVPAPAVMASLVPAGAGGSVSGAQQGTAALEKKLDQLGERLEKALAPIADSTTTTADIQKQLLAEAP